VKQKVGKNQNPAGKAKRVSRVSEVVAETVEVEAKAEDVECQTIGEAVETVEAEEILKAEEVAEIMNVDVVEDAVMPREVIVQEEKVKHHLKWLKQPVIIAKKKVICLVDAQTQGKKENFQIVEEAEVVAVAILKMIEVKVNARELVKFQILWQILHVITAKKKVICRENVQTQKKKEKFQIVEEAEVVAVEIRIVIEVKADLRVKFQILWQILHVIIVKKKVICRENVQTQEKKENLRNVEEVAVEAVAIQKTVEDVAGLMIIEGDVVTLKAIEVVVVAEEEVEIKTEML
jgi:hypothetical protein